MGKDSTKNLVGQPIFKQIINLIPKAKFDKLVLQRGSDKYYKAFFSWDQLVTMLFGIFSRCDSMGEVCDGMRALGGKLNSLGMDCSPAKSTAGDALRDRTEELFRLFYFVLIAYFTPVLSVSRKKKYRKEGVSFDMFYAFDSSTVSLFSNIMKGVGRNRKDDGKKKGGLKVHMLTDIHADMPQFVKISEAKMHDKNFLPCLSLAAGSMIVFDKAYNYYLQFAKWTEAGVNFVCRLKDNAKYEVQGEALFEKALQKEEFGVYKVEHIHINYTETVEVEVEGKTKKKKTKKKTKKKKTLCLRLVWYKDEQGRKYKFITNNWDISAEEVALIYKCRWSIETCFKKLKQNFQLSYFYSDTENGIKTQVWCTLIAYLLLQVVQTMHESKKAFSTIAALIRMHLISYLDMKWVVTEGRSYFPKRSKSRNKSPTTIQMSLF
ncbi:IS4 family transposase [Bacteroidales bacterium OttesenSCG-928-A14]|nr:IS4 family transposase [Bacteroidales bacterium OttesenSCG-928-A14]